jgi:hypothetical protein
MAMVSPFHLATLPTGRASRSEARSKLVGRFDRAAESHGRSRTRTAIQPSSVIGLVTSSAAFQQGADDPVCLIILERELA